MNNRANILERTRQLYFPHVCSSVAQWGLGFLTAKIFVFHPSHSGAS